jgi:hypothetical protein
MRISSQGTVLTVRAIAGLHVVILAWDLVTQPEKKVTKASLPEGLEDLLGFTVARDELDTDGNVVESYVLRGIKRFRGKDEGLAPGALVPLDEHPVQSFLWGDYTPKPSTTYDFTITPVHGTPKNLEVRHAAATTVRVTTEPEIAPDLGDGTARHDVHFNRGVIGSQAYARKFPNTEPDPDRPRSAPMKWLSRGLFEALLAFIELADDGDELHGAFYEFQYPPVASALRAAFDRGATVRIVYDAESTYKTKNVQTLTDAGLFENDIQFPRTVSEGIRHNKFIVLSREGGPVAVWTGSTNISPGGIFGHSNVGHTLWDGTAAQAYLDYWDRLAGNLTPGKLRQPNRDASPTPEGKPPPNSVTPLFSPRDEKDGIDTLQWYADRIGDATRLVCLTLAFNLDQIFSDVLIPESDILRYVVKDDALGSGETIGTDHDILFAAGGRLGEGALENFLAEPGNPLNSNDYIHTKFMLVDPLGNDPLVVTGSANFSRPSQRSNDENMLVIRGDTRVADVYFGEYMRIFDHHYARYIVQKLADEGSGDPDAGYLKETAGEWLPSQFNPKSYKDKRRRYFVEE